MNSIVSDNRLLFFKVEKYHYRHQHHFDTSDCPRPHFCMGLVLEGQGVFTDPTDGNEILLSPGDVIFVPMNSTYVSHWTGAPDIRYISAHFIFDRQSVFANPKRFSLQKVRPEATEEIERLYNQMFDQFGEDAIGQFGSLSAFYGLLHHILPKLIVQNTALTDVRLMQAVRYIEENYTQNITVEQLSSCCQMSMPRFFPKFKKQFGLTPVEYVNQYRITRAIILLMNGTASVEEIGDQVGFESTAYFRRVFKKFTGRSPRDFRKNAMEL